MRQVAHVLLTRPPLASLPEEIHSLDLHVLGTPPAFVLSQDQTLTKKFNHLLKLLWVLFLRLLKELLVYFNYILFNFQRPFTLSHPSDFFILSSTQLLVNIFLKLFCFLIKCCLLFWRLPYNIIIKIICQHILLIFFIFFKI